MGSLSVEVVGKFGSKEDANKLLYAPLSTQATFRKSRVYRLEFDGGDDLARAFVHKCLVDQYADDVTFDQKSYFDEYEFYIDYGMKPGALDLEKEAIISSQKGDDNSNFNLIKLELLQRVYVFSSSEVSSDPFVRDVCNPAIHVWSVIDSNGRKVA